MSSTTAPSAVRFADGGAPRPPCPGCALALRPVAADRRRFWICGACGISMPRR